MSYLLFSRQGALRSLLLLILLFLSACTAPDSRTSPGTPAAQPSPQVRALKTPETTSTPITEFAAPTLSPHAPTPGRETAAASPEAVLPCDVHRSPDPLNPCIPASRIPVLEYHDTEFDMKPTVQMKTEWFLAQMEWLSENGYRSLTGEELLRFVRGEARPPQRSVVLRFDIGLPVRFFAFPYDSVPARPGALLRPMGYALGFAGYRSERSVLFDDPNPYALPAYYVYSGEKTYPVITGTGGLTFGEMIEQAVARGK